MQIQIIITDEPERKVGDPYLLMELNLDDAGDVTSLMIDADMGLRRNQALRKLNDLIPEVVPSY